MKFFDGNLKFGAQTRLEKSPDQCKILILFVGKKNTQLRMNRTVLGALKSTYF